MDNAGYGISPGAAFALAVKGLIVSAISVALGLYAAETIAGEGLGGGLVDAHMRMDPRSLIMPMLLPLACGMGFMFIFAMAPAKWGWVAVAAALLPPAVSAGRLAYSVAMTQTTSLEVIAPWLGTVVHELTVIATAAVLCALFARILPRVRGIIPDEEERFHAPPPSFLVLLALFVKGLAAAGFAFVATIIIWGGIGAWAAPPAEAPTITAEELDAARQAAQAAAEEAQASPYQGTIMDLIRNQPLRNLVLPFVVGVAGMFAFALGGAAWQWLVAAAAYGLGPVWDFTVMALAAAQYPESSIVVFAPGTALAMFSFFVITLTLLTCGAFAKRVPYVA